MKEEIILAFEEFAYEYFFEREDCIYGVDVKYMADINHKSVAEMVMAFRGMLEKKEAES